MEAADGPGEVALPATRPRRRFTPGLEIRGLTSSTRRSAASCARFSTSNAPVRTIIPLISWDVRCEASSGASGNMSSESSFTVWLLGSGPSSSRVYSGAWKPIRVSTPIVYTRSPSRGTPEASSCSASIVISSFIVLSFCNG